MAKKLIVYTDPNCAACDSFIPEFEKRAKEAGLKYKKINVQQCPVNDPDCVNVEFVPTVMYGGREIDIEKVPELFRRLEKKGS